MHVLGCRLTNHNTVPRCVVLSHFDLFMDKSELCNPLSFLDSNFAYYCFLKFQHIPSIFIKTFVSHSLKVLNFSLPCNLNGYSWNREPSTVYPTYDMMAKARRKIYLCSRVCYIEVNLWICASTHEYYLNLILHDILIVYLDKAFVPNDPIHRVHCRLDR